MNRQEFDNLYRHTFKCDMSLVVKVNVKGYKLPNVLQHAAIRYGNEMTFTLDKRAVRDLKIQEEGISFIGALSGVYYKFMLLFKDIIGIETKKVTIGDL